MVILKQLSVVSNACMVNSELALIALRNSSLSMKNGRSLLSLLLEVRIFCREVVEPEVDCLKESSAITTCIINVSSRSAHVVILAPLVVNDCSKLGFTYHGW